MGDSAPRGHVTYDESHVNIKLPNRCRRCHTYNEDADDPPLSKSLVILLYRMTQSTGDACFLICLLLPFLGVTTVSLMLLLSAGYTTMFWIAIALIFIWLCFVIYFGYQYTITFSVGADLFTRLQHAS